MRVADLKPFHVETWAVSYELSVTSRRNYLRTVKRCLKWAHKQGYIAHNPIEHLEVPRGESKEVCIEAGDYARLLSYVRNSSLRDLIETTWETGCRPQESLRVEARHVDLDQRRWVFSQSESKGKRNSRVVYLSDRALEIVARLTRKSPEGRIFRNLNGKAWNPMAVNCAFGALRVRMGKDEMKRRGEVIDDKTVAAFMKTLNPEKVSKGRAFMKTETELRAEARRKLTDKRARELAPRYSLYALRHSWATHALRKGIDPLTVAILMGHKDPSTLAKVYQHLS
ncbi:MAG: tyrosine-type recombinase/integrase, partial [bacterium]|nr:tyrosine-type recombinase/integrase [bacterium]